jgi:regulator of sigma E protease
MLLTLVSFIVLLIILIFVHELGHFLAAKLVGVRVETFSLGFPPRLFSKKIGETLYQVAWIPLGGYVKLFGEQPDQEVDPREIHRSFSHKPFWAKSLIVLAGPFFNIIFAVIALIILSWAVGIQHAAPIVGPLDPESPAARAGIVIDDVVTHVNGVPVSYYDEILDAMEKSDGSPVTLDIKRGTSSLSVSVTPEKREGATILGDKEDFWYFGMAQRTLPIIEEAFSDKPASKAGIQKGDLIVAVNGKKTQDWAEVVRAVRGSALNLEALAHEIIAPEAAPGESPGAADSLDAASTEAGSGTEPEAGEEASPASSSGDTAAAASASSSDSASSDSASSDAASSGSANPILFTIERDGKTLEISVIPDMDPSQGLDGKTVFTPIVGVTPRLDLLIEPVGPVTALGMGFSQTFRMTELTILSFVKLVQRKISPKLMGGPIMIAEVAGKTARNGLADFIWLMAFISINLAIINLVPLPILDGGQFVIFLIEAIKRGPLSDKVKGVTQWIGITAMAALMIMVFYNDIARLVTKFSGPPTQIERVE